MRRSSVRAQITADELAVNSLSVRAEDYESWLPPDNALDEDIWNVGSWLGRADRALIFKLDFRKIENHDIRILTKTYIVYSRATKRISPQSSYKVVRAAESLSKFVGEKTLHEITSADLIAATPSSYIGKGMSLLASFMKRHYGCAIHFKTNRTANVKHGSKGTDEGRRTKLISDEVLYQLASINRTNLNFFDRVYLSGLQLNIPCGFRIGELTCLKFDCLRWDEGQLYIDGHSSKGGTAVSKLVPAEVAPMVLSAYNTLLKMSEEGRECCRRWQESSEPDWERVVRDPEALDYFARKLLHAWTSDHNNFLINPNGAWHSTRGWIDILGPRAYFPSDEAHRRDLNLSPEIYGSLKRQHLAAREGKIWRPKNGASSSALKHDRRVCDKYKLFNLMGFASGRQYFSIRIDALINEAIGYQSSGSNLPPPPFDIQHEDKYRRLRPILIKNPDGTPKVYVDEALFVFEKNALSSFKKKDTMFQVVSGENFSHWLSGNKSRASVFERFDIRDPKTGALAKFTTHDIRHWLETQLHRGGLSNAQIGVLMGRKRRDSGSPYNQMSNAQRRDFVREGIHSGTIDGVLPQILKSSKIARTEAHSILDSRLRFVNVMPHGFCLQNLASQPCPHHMSCFSAPCGSVDVDARGPCEHLLVDATDENQRADLNRQRDNAVAMVDMLSEDDTLADSPQLEHFEAILTSIASILKD